MTSSPETLAHGEGDEQRHRPRTAFDRHGPLYRTQFEELTADLQSASPVVWNDTHGGYWFASGSRELFDIARRSELLSNDNDYRGERRGYQGISIPPPTERVSRGGFLELDPPAQKDYRQAINPYLSPAAVKRWQPFLDEITRACLDEVIESGRLDFVDDLANIVPAVLTLAMLGAPLREWDVYCEPTHASVYTSPDSPDYPRVRDLSRKMAARMFGTMREIRANPRPGLIHALLTAPINGTTGTDQDVIEAIMLIIGGGFDTTTALTAHALQWLSQHPADRTWLIQERENLLDSATEEFLRYFTPAVGDGRTITTDCEIAGVQFQEGERIWLSWAMANRDPVAFDHPNEIQLDRKHNRHNSFGLGTHRCVGSNFARAAFKTMMTHVLERLPDFQCDPAGAMAYDSTGVINGMRHLPATFSPGKRLGPGFEETLEKLQIACDEQRLAEPVTIHKGSAQL